MFNFFLKRKTKNSLPHWGDSKKWVENVIESVESVQQTKVCRELIYNWGRQYSESLDQNTIRNISRELMIKCDGKYYGLKEEELLNYKKKSKKK